MSRYYIITVNTAVYVKAVISHYSVPINYNLPIVHEVIDPQEYCLYM